MNPRLWAGVTATAVSVAAFYKVSTRDNGGGGGDDVANPSSLKPQETPLAPNASNESSLNSKTQRHSDRRRIFTEIIEKLPAVFPPPSNEWNHNWDGRWPKKSAIKAEAPAPAAQSCPGQVDAASPTTSNAPTSSRHIFLIRHGQYHTERALERDRKLTTLGQEQLDLTGKRLTDLGFPFSRLVASTMTRAQESARIIHKRFPDLSFESDGLLEEGAPVPPEPPVESWTPPMEQFLEDGPRIESAFRKYFHRANPSQQNDSHEIIVCHGNVIRFFVCRALQIPPEAWLRLGLNHGSITWLTIRPSGRVVLQSLGTTGYMPPKKISSF